MGTDQEHGQLRELSNAIADFTRAMIEIERQNAERTETLLAVARATTQVLTAMANSLATVGELRGAMALEHVNTRLATRKTMLLYVVLIAASNVVGAVLLGIILVKMGGK